MSNTSLSSTTCGLDMDKATKVHDCRREASPRESGVSEFMGEPSSRYHAFAHSAVADLKRKSVQGGVVAVCAQGAKFGLQTATIMLLARLLSAEDFGLQGMVVALTGFLGLFREAGLGAAAVQRLEGTQERVC